MQDTLFDSFGNTKQAGFKHQTQTKTQSNNLVSQNPQNENVESQDCGITIYRTDDEKTKAGKYALIHIRTYYTALKDEIENWTRQKFKEEENFSIAFVKYEAPKRLGESGCITIDTQSEAIFHYGITSYRMGSSAAAREEVRQLLLEAYNEKRRELSVPYCNPKVAQGFGLRSTKPENIKVFLTPRAKEFILSLNINVDKFLHCYESLKGSMATEDDISEARKFAELEQQIEKEKAECKQVKSIVSNIFGISYCYEKKEIDISGVDITELAQRFLGLKNHIAEHEEMIQRIRNKYRERKTNISQKD